MNSTLVWVQDVVTADEAQSLSEKLPSPLYSGGEGSGVRGFD
jgi:hypothetical protein